MATDSRVSELIEKFEALQQELAQIAPSLKNKQVLFIYNSKHLKGSSKVKFFYALKGRQNCPGILAQTNSKFLKRGVILAPFENFSKVSEFLHEWDCSFKALQVERELK